ncbi:MAG: hypothetical protein S4CHLAM7_12410 [Chlamydiae bacterium]|nr:hypothetical protein [Chlamydiota bacterium]
MTTKKTLKYCMDLNWSFIIEQEENKGQKYFIIRVNELPGICTDAESVEEGMVLIQEAIKAAIKLYLKNGEVVPEPIKKDKFKGNIAYRTSNFRHYQLAKLAREQNKSISKTIDYLIDTHPNHLAM